MSLWGVSLCPCCLKMLEEMWNGVAASINGPNNANDRVGFWSELTLVARTWDKSWVLDGDFNVTRFPSEQRGGCVMTIAMRGFSD